MSAIAVTWAWSALPKAASNVTIIAAAVCRSSGVSATSASAKRPYSAASKSSSHA
jgi:hypothetical protein